MTRNNMSEAGQKEKDLFRFKKFVIKQDICPMKVNTDGILLGAWAKTDGGTKALDIGTGTGLIALMLAQKNERLQLDAIDIDEKAYQQAFQNFKSNDLGKNIQALCINFQVFQEKSVTQYDIIISNPPFFTGGTFSSNENKSFVRHTIKLSHNGLLSGVRKLLKKNGNFYLILPFAEGIRFIEIAEMYGLFLSSLTEVFTRKNKPVERLLMCFSDTKINQPERMTLQIMEENSNDYSKEFINLTKDYYLFM